MDKKLFIENGIETIKLVSDQGLELGFMMINYNETTKRVTIRTHLVRQSILLERSING